LKWQAEFLQARAENAADPPKHRFLQNQWINALISRFFKNWRFSGSLQRFLRACKNPASKKQELLENFVRLSYLKKERGKMVSEGLRIFGSSGGAR